MTVMPSCPTHSELEEHVAAGEPASPIGDHVAACPSCRERIDRIRAENRFVAEIVSAAAEPDVADGAGESIGGYDIGRVIGRGGQAIVYEAFQRSTQRRVAIKVLLTTSRRAAAQAQRFHREIELAASLRHPAIVAIYDSGQTDDGRLYFAMEHVEGRPVTEHAAASTEEVLQLFARICDAISYSHQHGIIHRDLKPSNILIDAEGNPRILDFGLAKVIDPSARAMLTASGEFVGTLAYAAPEQLRGHPDAADVRADVYALGVVLYEMLTGRPPYPVTGSVAEVVARISEGRPPPPSAHRPGLGDEVDTIVLTALAGEPMRRYQSAAALLDDVQRYLAGGAISAKRDSTWYVLRKTMRRHRAALAVGAAFFIFLVAFSVTMAVLFRKEQVAQILASDRAEALSATLRSSTLERARLMNATGNGALAERLAWSVRLDGHETIDPPDDACLSVSPSYWALWEVYRSNPCLATAALHKSSVLSLAVAEDGTVISCGADGTVVQWDPATGRRRTALRLAVPTLPERRYVPLTGDGTKVVRLAGTMIEVWDVATGARIARSEDAGAALSRGAADWHADRVAAAADDGRIVLWEPGSGALRELVRSDTRMMTLALTPDGSRLVSASPGIRSSATEGSIRVWDTESGALLAAAPFDVMTDRVTLRVSRDGRLVARRAGDKFEIRRVSDLEVAGRSADHFSTASAADLAPDGRLIATSSTDKIVRLAEWDSGEQIAARRGHDSQVAAVAFAPDGRTLASGDARGTVKIWETADDGCVTWLRTPGVSIHQVAFSADDRFMAACGAEQTGGLAEARPGVLQLWDLSTGSRVAVMKGHRAPVADVTFTSDGRQLISSSFDGTIRLWDLPGATQAAVIPFDGEVACIDLSPDGRTLVAGRNRGGGDVWVLDLADRRLLATLSTGAPRIPSVRFSPDGRLFAAAASDGEAVLWDARTLARAATLRGHEGAVRVARFSPDGRLLATGGDDRTIRLWDTSTGRHLRTLTGHKWNVFALALSPDGRLLASGAASVIMLWDVSKGLNLARLEGHRPGSLVMSLAFLPDGHRLVSAGTDGRIGMWDLTWYGRHVAGNLEYQRSRPDGPDAD